jgi:enoyl-CoA hydratase
MPRWIRIEGPKDGVATLVLARPEKRNALSIALRDEISDALDALAQEASLKVLIVTGDGDTFCAGFDLKEFESAGDPEFGRKLWASSDRYHRTVLEFPLPTLAALNGPALAGGFDLAVLCDVRIAVPKTWFAHPEIAFGDVVYGPLRELVGGALARELCLTGRRVDAEEALRLHLVSAVVEPGRLLEGARRIAAEIARAPREVLLRTKAKILRHAGVRAGATLDL